MKERIGLLFEDQSLAVLATSLGGHPYTTLVAVVATQDLRYLFFATTRPTRKFANIQADSRVSLLVDSRQHNVHDFRQALALTALGHASAIEGSAHEEGRLLLLAKFPQLKDFIDAPTCVLFRVEVQKYIMVDHFQHVIEWTVEK